MVKLFLPMSGCLGFIEGTKEGHFCLSLNQEFKGRRLAFTIVGVIEILKERINFWRPRGGGGQS